MDKLPNNFKTLGSVDPEKRKDFASSLNKIKDDLTSQIEQKNFEIENAEINDKLKNEKVDVTLPIRPYQQGKIHPVSQVIDEISSIFLKLVFLLPKDQTLRLSIIILQRLILRKIILLEICMILFI